MYKITFKLLLGITLVLIFQNHIKGQNTGVADPTFGTSGLSALNLGANFSITQMVTTTDNKILACGLNATNIMVVRMNNDGSLDPTFDSDGALIVNIGFTTSTVSDICQDLNGKIVVTGSYNSGSFNTDIFVLRLNSNGSLDNSFNTTGIRTFAPSSSYDRSYACKVNSAGKIILGGYYYNGSNDDLILYSINDNGTMDTGFDVDGILGLPIGGAAAEQAADMLISKTNDIYMIGHSNFLGTPDILIIKVNSAGVKNTGFDTDGIKLISIGSSFDYPQYGELDENENLVIGGFYSNGGNQNFLIRVNGTTGSLDNTFDTDGIKLFTGFSNPLTFSNVTIDRSNKIYLFGSENTPGGMFGDNNYMILCLNEDGSYATNFNTTGLLTIDKTDDDIFEGGDIDAIGNIVVCGPITNGMETYRFTAAIPSIRLTPLSSTLTATYGTASNAASYKMASSYLNENISIQASNGTDISLDNLAFGKTLTLNHNAGFIPNTTIYVRTTATLPAGSYAEKIQHNATSRSTDYTLNCIINKAPLTITVKDTSREYELPNPLLSYSYTGFKNTDNSDSIDVFPTPAFPALNELPGGYSVSLSGGSDNNYTLTNIAGVFVITKAKPNARFVYPDLGIVSGDLPFFDTLSRKGTGAIDYKIISGGHASIDAVSGLFNSTQGFTETIIIRGIVAATVTHFADTAYSIINMFKDPFPPVAVDDTLYMTLNEELVIGDIFKNDVVLLGRMDSLTIDLNLNEDGYQKYFSNYYEGVSKLDTNLNFTFKPVIGFLGLASLKYRFKNTRNQFSNEATILIYVRNDNELIELDAPEIITPNGDNQNDYFFIRYADNTETNKLFIYDRHGFQVYSSNDYKNDWNGQTFNDKPLDDGYYYFLFTETKNNRIIKGALVLKR